MNNPGLLIDKCLFFVYFLPVMQLTFNQTLWLVIAVASVVAIAFLAFLFAQLRKTAKAAEQTLLEIKELIIDIKETDQLIKTKIQDIGEVIDVSKKAAKNLSVAGSFLSTKVLRPSTKYMAILLPLLQLGWRQLKKKKEGKHVK